MSESIKDQLLALGLAPGPTNRKRNRHGKTRLSSGAGKQDATDISLEQAYRIRNTQERQQIKQAAARKREIERERRQTNQKIKSIINTCAIRDKSADIKRNFLYKGRIRSVLVTREQISAINDGRLGIVYLSGNYHLLPSSEVERVRKFAPAHVPDLRGTERDDEQDHPVPDDLIW